MFEKELEQLLDVKFKIENEMRKPQFIKQKEFFNPDIVGRCYYDSLSHKYYKAITPVTQYVNRGTFLCLVLSNHFNALKPTKTPNFNSFITLEPVVLRSYFSLPNLKEISDEKFNEALKQTYDFFVSMITNEDNIYCTLTGLDKEIEEETRAKLEKYNSIMSDWGNGDKVSYYDVSDLVSDFEKLNNDYKFKKTLSLKRRYYEASNGFYVNFSTGENKYLFIPKQLYHYEVKSRIPLTVKTTTDIQFTDKLQEGLNLLNNKEFVQKLDILFLNFIYDLTMNHNDRMKELIDSIEV